MTSISYKEIFNDFLGNVTDYTLASLNLSDATELLVEYLHKTLAQTYIRRLFSTITYDDEIQTISFEMDYIVDDDADKDFVQNVLSNGMTVEWLKPQVRNRVNVAQMFGNTKDSKFYSQSSHISEIRAMLEDTQIELRKLIRDRGYVYNDYLGDS